MKNKTKQVLFLRISWRLTKNRDGKKRLLLGKICIFNLNENHWTQTHTTWKMKELRISRKTIEGNR